VREGAGLVIMGAALLSAIAMVVGGAPPVLATMHRGIFQTFGFGWPLPVAAALALGGLLIWPVRVLPRPRDAVAVLIGVAAVFGLLTIVRADAGGAVGHVVSGLLVALVGDAGAILLLVVVLLLSLVVAFHFSVGDAVLGMTQAARAAYAERQRVEELVQRSQGKAAGGSARSPRRQPAPEPEAAASEDRMAGVRSWLDGVHSRFSHADDPVGAATDTVAEPEPVPTHDPVGPEPTIIDDADFVDPEPGIDDPEEALETLAQAEATWAEDVAARPPAAKRVEPEVLRVTADPEDDEDEWEGIEWRLPPVSLLETVKAKRERIDEEIKRNVRVIENTLETFGVQARVIDVNSGPAVTQYELQPAAGVAVKRVVALQNDLALALAASPLRIEAPIPGKSAIGVEVPNKAAATVSIREVVEAPNFFGAGFGLSVTLGNDVSGRPIVADLTRMPHLLIAGATGQGKSSCINALISSLLLQATPEQLRLVLIDPKRVELTFYNALPHLAVPVITESHEASAALRWAVVEMDRRYRLLSAEGVRNIQAYNDKADAQRARRLPYIVVVIDELADLMMVAAGEVEELICRIAQLARAVGIHLVVATQRPSTDIITGLIKANMPSRIAFAVGSQVDSRVILDTAGAEKLLGRGDMLYQPIDAGKPLRVQGAWVSNKEVESLVEFWKRQADPSYINQVLESATGPGSGDEGSSRKLDPLFPRAARAICAEGTASVSLIQRKLNVGYARAGRIVDQLADQRVVGAYQGSKSREVLMTLPDVDDLLERLGLEG
jgi:S-DNA-T family DNA segregation ATPase FtsK/SpoIIIE